MEKKDIYRSQFRLPQELYILLKESADRNRRNLNAELIFRLDIALNEERLEQNLAQWQMTRDEFEANARAVERAFPAITADASEPVRHVKDDLDVAIKRLSASQRDALLKFVESMGG